MELINRYLNLYQYQRHFKYEDQNQFDSVTSLITSGLWILIILGTHEKQRHQLHFEEEKIEMQ